MGELHKLPQKQDCCGCSAFEQACSVLSPYEVCTPQSRPYYEYPQRAYLFRHYKTQMNSVFENTQSK